VPRRALVVPRRAELCPSGLVVPHRADLCWRPSGRVMLEAFGPRDVDCRLRVYGMMRLCVETRMPITIVADGADRDGADHEGADVRLVDADLASGRLVEGSFDVALRALRNCAAVMRGVIERRRDGDADGVWEKSRRAGDADEEQIVLRIVTVRSYHDRTPCVLCDSKPSLTPDHPSQRPRVTKPGACDACRTRDPDTYQTRVE
jgi:hypothetical protein